MRILTYPRRMEESKTVLAQHTPSLFVELGAGHSFAQKSAAEDIFALDLFLFVCYQLLSSFVRDAMGHRMQLQCQPHPQRDECSASLLDG